MTKESKKTKVFVGLSGGVDSAVSAALLKKEGYDVTGVFIKAWTPFDDAQGTRKIACGWKEDRRSAMRAAAVLDIPFITLDLEKEYKREVVDYMVAEYKKGRTPNPDVMCNKEIKFGYFLRFALRNDADYVATGHYAQNESRETSHEKRERKDLVPHASYFLLREGTDSNKDQSYFLWTLTQKQLRHTLFPIGHLQKSDVRKLAEKFGLPQAVRKDSQGLCFLGKVDMKEFLSKYIPPKKGSVLDVEGNKIGWHNGVLFFTIGERHGFTVTEKTDKEVPLYVIDKNIAENTITVAPQTTPQKSSGQGASLCLLKEVSWVSGKTPDTSKKYSCRIRYRQNKIGCKIENKAGKVKVIFDEPQAGVSPGQSLVLYDRDVCLGGGIIQL